MTDAADILIYQSPEGEVEIDVRLEDETVWLTQDESDHDNRVELFHRKSG